MMAEGYLPEIDLPEILLERTKNKSYGDFSTNIALILAKPAKMDSLIIASLLVKAMPKVNFLSNIAIAAPGFINFTLSKDSKVEVIKDILATKKNFGRSLVGEGKSVHVEFVSANPTGPLHIGHGRSAAYGSVISNLLAIMGFNVHREYYVNDAGRQMDILATSVWLRYLNACGETIVFPNNGYKGDYVVNIGETLLANNGSKFFKSALEIFNDLPADKPNGGDREHYIDALIKKAKKLLGSAKYYEILHSCLNTLLSNISDDLSNFGNNYDEWFSELSLVNSGEVDRTIEQLKYANVLYQRDGAWWFRATEFGDEKDRVVIRNNGQKTYFASDLAYHRNKFQRGFDTVINIWGADHHGYIPRIRGGILAMNLDTDRLKIVLVQFAALYQGNKKVAMSTRSGEFVTLKQLYKEVGKDAARFFYVMRSADQHMEFDLELAKSQTNDNPVYYVQYAHARICGVFRQLSELNLDWDQFVGESNIGLLVEDHEASLLVMLSRYPEVLESAALNYTPHILANFLVDLARGFHTYYNTYHFIIDDNLLRQARLTLAVAVRQVIANGLTILGVSTPESM